MCEFGIGYSQSDSIIIKRISEDILMLVKVNLCKYEMWYCNKIQISYYRQSYINVFCLSDQLKRAMMKESTTSLSSRKKADSNAECDENHGGLALKHGEVMHKHQHSPAVNLLHQTCIQFSITFWYIYIYLTLIP